MREVPSFSNAYHSTEHYMSVWALQKHFSPRSSICRNSRIIWLYLFCKIWGSIFFPQQRGSIFAKQCSYHFLKKGWRHMFNENLCPTYSHIRALLYHNVTHDCNFLSQCIKTGWKPTLQCIYYDTVSLIRWLHRISRSSSFTEWTHEVIEIYFVEVHERDCLLNTPLHKKYIIAMWYDSVLLTEIDIINC